MGNGTRYAELAFKLHEKFGLDLSLREVRELLWPCGLSGQTSQNDAPTESILHPLADREKSADHISYSDAMMSRARDNRKWAATLIKDAEMLEQLAYDTADYCGGGEP